MSRHPQYAAPHVGHASFGGPALPTLPTDDRRLQDKSYVDKPKLAFALLYLNLMVTALLAAVTL